MATEFLTFVEDLRIEVGDFVEAFVDQEYSNRQLANLAVRGTKENNRRAFQKYGMSGTGDRMTFTPDPEGADYDLLLLFWAKAVAQAEYGEAKRVGFSVSNVAGRVDGRERFTSAREGVRDLEGRIRQELKQRGMRKALAGGAWRPMTRSVTNSGSELTL